MRAVTLAAIVCLLSSTQTSAQDIVDLPWSFSEQGQLLWKSLPERGSPPEPWQPVFPGLLDESLIGAFWSTQFAPSGLFPLLPLLLTGDGGAAANTEAELRLRKLGVPVAFPIRTTSMRDPNPLLDLLRARHLGGLGLFAANQTLAAWARDPNRNAFVRAEAFRQLSTQADADFWTKWDEVQAGRAIRHGPASLQDALRRLPDDFTLLLGVHSAALPTPQDLFPHWRRLQMRIASNARVSSGDSLSPAQYRTGQLEMDRPGQLPFELAERFGNWRIDYALFALRGPTDQVWLHLGGTFDASRVYDGLRQEGFACTLDAGVVRATVGDWTLTVTDTACEVSAVALMDIGRGGHAPEYLDRAAPGSSPLWLHAHGTNALLTRQMPAIERIEIGFDPRTLRAEATAHCGTKAAAGNLRAEWQQFCDTRRCEPGDRVEPDQTTTWQEVASMPAGIGERERTRWIWRRCVQAIECTLDGDTVHWQCDLSSFGPEDLVRLLSLPPLVLLQHG